LLVVIGDARAGSGKIAGADRVGVEQARLRLCRGRALLALVGGDEVGHVIRRTRLRLVFLDIECFLDCRQRRLGRIRHLLRIIGHFGRSLACYA